MELKANVNFERFEAALQVVDAHTVGEFCRVAVSYTHLYQRRQVRQKGRFLLGSIRMHRRIYRLQGCMYVLTEDIDLHHLCSNGLHIYHVLQRC